MTYDSVLFDHDGVLVDILQPTELYARFSQQAATPLQELGVEPSESVIDTLYLRVSREEAIALGERFGVEPETLWQTREDVIDELLTAAVRDGEKAPYHDISTVENLSLPTGIVSNNQTRIVEDITTYHGIRSQFDTLRARKPRLASLTRKKPEPTFIREAMSDLGVANPLYVGDSETDVLAGQRAGVAVAFIRREHNRAVDLSTTPTYEIDSLDAIPDILDS